MFIYHTYILEEVAKYLSVNDALAFSLTCRQARSIVCHIRCWTPDIESRSEAFTILKGLRAILFIHQQYSYIGASDLLLVKDSLRVIQMYYMPFIDIEAFKELHLDVLEVTTGTGTTSTTAYNTSLLGRFNMQHLLVLKHDLHALSPTSYDVAVNLVSLTLLDNLMLVGEAGDDLIKQRLIKRDTLRGLTRLHHLAVDNYPIEEDALEGLNLLSLSITSHYYPHQKMHSPFNYTKAILRQHSLTHLSIKTDVIDLDHITHLTTLKHLVLHTRGEQQWYDLSLITHLTNLEHLSMRLSDLYQKALIEVRHIKTMTKLRSLKLSVGHFILSLDELSKCLRLLESLSIDVICTMNYGMFNPCVLTKFKHLKSLSCNMLNILTEHIGPNMFKGLEQLSCFKLKADDQFNGEYISHLTNLETLVLSGPPKDIMCLRDKHVEGMTKLERLEVKAGSHITWDSILKMTRLETLVLDGWPEINEAVCKTLTNLVRLEISHYIPWRKFIGLRKLETSSMAFDRRELPDILLFFPRFNPERGDIVGTKQLTYDPTDYY